MSKNRVIYACAISASIAAYFSTSIQDMGGSTSEDNVSEKPVQIIKNRKDDQQEQGVLRTQPDSPDGNVSQLYSSNSNYAIENELVEKVEIADALYDKSVFDIVEPLIRRSSMFELRSSDEQKEEAAAFIVESRWRRHYESAGLNPVEQQRASDLLIRFNTHNLELSHAYAQGLSAGDGAERYKLSDIERELRNILPGEKVDSLIEEYVEVIANRPISIEHAKVYEDRANYPAFAAVTSGDAVELNAYLAAGTSVNELRNYDSGQSLLHYAISLESEDLVEVIVDYEPRLDIKDSHGNTPLNLAAKQGNIEMVRLLLEAGADPTSRDAIGLTPAMGARLRGLRASDPYMHNQTADYIERYLVISKGTC